MKYQQLDNLESGWKWQYLIRKHHEGVVITRHLDQQASEEAVNLLLCLRVAVAFVPSCFINCLNLNL